MNEVAQGRVWTGKQAQKRGLVDHIGGLWKAIEIASVLAEDSSLMTASTLNKNRNILNIKSKSASVDTSINKKKEYNIEVFRPPRSGFSLPFGGGSSIGSGSTSSLFDSNSPLYLCDDTIASTGLASPDTLGTSGMVQSLGCGSLLGYFINHDPKLKVLFNNFIVNSLSTSSLTSTNSLTSRISQFFENIFESETF